jgi:hypothetical protein
MHDWRIKMTTFLSRGCIMIVLLCLGQPVFADEDIPKGKPLPQRDTPVSKVEGYADWKFTDSLETLQSDVRLTFIEAGEENCEFGKDEKRDQSRWPDCFYYETKIFQEPAKIFILVVKERIERILIHFNRLDSKADSKDCAAVIQSVVANLVKKFGIPTRKNDAERQAFWESSYGGTLEFQNNCISEDRGLVLFVFSPTPGPEKSEP